MKTVSIILKIARYEFKLLTRSWGFRIFALLGFLFLTIMTIAITSPSAGMPHFYRSLSGSIPLFVLKLFNVFQGVIAAFLATEFFKRDRRSDSTQVVYSRSFTNAGYVVGKFIGVFGVFVVLNLLLLLITFSLSSIIMQLVTYYGLAFGFDP